MAIPTIMITVSGTKIVRRRLLGYSARAKDLYPVYSALAAFLYANEEELFFTEGHGDWPDLADSTFVRKVTEEGLDSRILVATGRLKDSLTHPGGDNILEFEPIFRFGTDVPYAIFHQKGTENMPQRKVIDLTEADRRFMIGVVKSWITRGIVRV